MKKWAFPAVVAFFAIVAVAAGAVALTDDGGEDDGARVSLDVDENDGTNVAPVCAPDVPDCEDMIVNPDGDGGEDPDEPVSSDQTPITIIDGQDPNECNLVHNINACEKEAIARAIEDLSLRLGSPQAITLKSVEFVQWPDSCIGINKADVACAEVITPGFKIVLAVGEQTFEYHTDMETRVELVE